MKEYNRGNFPLAKALGKNMMPWERKLWYDFLRYYPVRFQRQKAIGNFIADFYCERQGWSSKLTEADTMLPRSQKKMYSVQKN